MSTATARRAQLNAPGTPPDRPGRGPNGRPLCCWCGTEVEKGRQRWCSQSCVDAYRLTTWQGACAAVFRRDRGVCACCSLDTEAARASYRAWWDDQKRAAGVAGWTSDTPHLLRDVQSAWLAFHGIPLGRLGGRRWYDVDHIVSVADGGTHALDNLRTLCVRCHVARTAAWHRTRALAARPAAPAPEGRADG